MKTDDIKAYHILPYFHHDYAWCNTRSWHIWRYVRAFEQVLDEMEKNRELTLTVDNYLHSLREFVRYCPERMDEFQRLVKEGRICVANGGMSLARPAFFDGELYLRNAQDAVKLFCELFDIPCENLPLGREQRTVSEQSYLDCERAWDGQIWANGYLRMKCNGQDVAVTQGSWWSVTGFH